MVNNQLLHILLILTLATVEMATDIYTPSLPFLKDYFAISEDLVQLTISCNLLGIAISGFFYGPLSDSYGRKRLILAGISIFLIGSIICALAANIWILIIARFLQGVGAGCAWVLALAMVGDLYEKKESSKIISLLGITMSVSPAISPVIGGFIGEFFGWKINFVLLSLISSILLVFLWKFLPETLKNKDRHIFSLKKILENSVVLFKNKVFLRNSLISSFIYASLWGFIATAPFVFNSLGVQQVDFGLYTLLVVIFYMAGAAFNSYCINHFSSKFLIWAGLLGTLLGGITLLFITLYAKVSPLMLVGVVGLYTFSMSFVFPNVTSNALDAVDSSLGMASSMLSGLEMFMAALAIYFMGNAQNTNFLNVSFGFIFSSIICIVIFKTLHPRFIKI